MRRLYEGVTVDALGRLQHVCRGHLFGIPVTGRRMSLLDPGYLVVRAHGSGSLISRWPWLAHQWPRGLFALIDPRGVLFGP